MSLQNYSDQELLDELKRRKIARRKDSRSYDVSYLYATATVVKADIEAGNKGYWSFKVKFTEESKVKYGDKLDEARSYGIMQSVFNKSNSPRVGDLVKLKKRITQLSPDWSRCWRQSPVICEIIKRNSL